MITFLWDIDLGWINRMQALFVCAFIVADSHLSGMRQMFQEALDFSVDIVPRRELRMTLGKK